MCGINGFSHASLEDPGLSRKTIDAMNAGLLHRGPDHAGSADAGQFTIGMQRLSIIDLSNGSQPMHTQDGRYSIVYNGEIYGYSDKRKELQSKGAVFKTQADTEVVLHGFAQEGPDFCRQLNGIFGFCIVDREEDTTWLVRDQLGIKPLYYYHHGSTLVFSSELHSLVQHPSVPRKLNYDALASLLCDRSVPETGTMFAGVQQVPPGHMLRFTNNQIEIKPYYEMTFAPEPMEFEQALEELTSRLHTSVESQMVADVPVGAFLSGGVDSSTVVALAKQYTDQQLQTFSIGFSVAEYDESNVARQVAEHLGTQHHTLTVQNAGYDHQLLEDVVRHTGQPLGDTSCIPTLLVSRFAAEHVKVVLSGDGGDEFFGGYNHIGWARSILKYSKLFPGALVAPTSALLGAVPSFMPSGVTNNCRRLRRAIELFNYPPAEQMRRLMSMWTPEEVYGLLGKEAALLPPNAVPMSNPGTLDGASYAMEYLAKTYMVSGILRKVDRMSMAASLEVRVPLLDQRIVEFALRTPLDLKLKDGVGKYLLREAGRNMLPKAVYDHPKQGFSPPLAQWFNDEYWAHLQDAYRPGSDAASLFDAKMLKTSIDQAQNAYGNQSSVSHDNAANRAWVLSQLAIWLDMYSVTV